MQTTSSPNDNDGPPIDRHQFAAYLVMQELSDGTIRNYAAMFVRWVDWAITKGQPVPARAPRGPGVGEDDQRHQVVARPRPRHDPPPVCRIGRHRRLGGDPPAPQLEARPSGSRARAGGPARPSRGDGRTPRSRRPRRALHGCAPFADRLAGVAAGRRRSAHDHSGPGQDPGPSRGPNASAARRTLEERRGPGELWVFTGRYGGHVSPATIWQWVLHVAEGAGIGRVTPHQLRHTALTAAHDATKDLRAVQDSPGIRRSGQVCDTEVNRRRLDATVGALSY